MDLIAVPGRLARKGADLVLTVGGALWRRGAGLIGGDRQGPPTNAPAPTPAPAPTAAAAPATPTRAPARKPAGPVASPPAAAPPVQAPQVPSAPPAPAPAPEPDVLAPPAPAPVPEPDVLVASSADPGAEEGVGANLHVEEPWPGYRQMTAADITDRLTVADRSTLGAVQLYESLHRRRRTVIAEAERRLAQAVS